MYRFSRHSQKQLATLHPLLREVLATAIRDDDFRVDQGGRTREEQWEAFRTGRSRVPGDADFAHRVREDGYAYAADIWPYVKGQRLAVPSWGEIVEMDREDVRRAVAAYAQFAWLMRNIWEIGRGLLEAHRLQTGQNFYLRLGLNWNRDAEILTDQTLWDFPHVELRRRDA